MDSEIQSNGGAQEAGRSSLHEVLECLAARWDREGEQLIEQASVASSWERDAELRNDGCARCRCAKELRAELEKHSNYRTERSAGNAGRSQPKESNGN